MYIKILDFIFNIILRNQSYNDLSIAPHFANHPLFAYCCLFSFQLINLPNIFGYTPEV